MIAYTGMVLKKVPSQGSQNQFKLFISENCVTFLYAQTGSQHNAYTSQIIILEDVSIIDLIYTSKIVRFNFLFV